jgi:hypothetical protein
MRAKISSLSKAFATQRARKRLFTCMAADMSLEAQMDQQISNTKKRFIG